MTQIRPLPVPQSGFGTRAGKLGLGRTGPLRMVVMISRQDENHLKLPEIFHYVAAGVTVLVGCIPFIHLAIGIALQLVPVEDHPATEIRRFVG